MSVKHLAKHKYGVLYRFGRLLGVRRPGFFITLPFIDRIVKVDPRVEPTDARGYWNRTVVHAALGMVTEAIADLEKCISLNPPKDREPRGSFSIRFSHEITSEETKWLMEQLRTPGSISRLRLLITNGKQEHAEMTREEAVESFRRRIKEAEERKKQKK